VPDAMFNRRGTKLRKTNSPFLKVLTGGRQEGKDYDAHKLLGQVLEQR
jgi:hypothetical protein